MVEEGLCVIVVGGTGTTFPFPRSLLGLGLGLRESKEISYGPMYSKEGEVNWVEEPSLQVQCEVGVWVRVWS